MTPFRTRSRIRKSRSTPFWLIAVAVVVLCGELACADDAPIRSPRTARTAPPVAAKTPPLPKAAPSFSLPAWSDAKSSPHWQSNAALGETAVFLLLLAKEANAGLSQAVLSSDFSFQFVVASPDPQLLKQLNAAHQAGSTPSAGKVVLLHDDKNTLRRDFALQEQFDISPTQSALLVIDRAGWLRCVEKVSSAAELTSVFQSIGDPTPLLAVGQRAPDFVLSDMNGILRRPADLRGQKYLLLTFFPKCFTGTCTKQLESLRDQWSELQANDIAVWGVSVDPAGGEKGQRSFAEFLQLPFPLLPDTGRRLSILYGAAQSPNQSAARMSVLIDKNGIVRWIDKQINPTTHGADVVVKVRSLTRAPDPEMPRDDG